MGRFLTIAVVALTLAAGPVAAQLTYTGAYTLTGKRLEPTVQGSQLLFAEPFTLQGDLMWEPARDRWSVGLATPASTFTDLIWRGIGAEPEPWLSGISEAVYVGLNAWWVREKAFPIDAGVYYQVKLSEWSW